MNLTGVIPTRNRAEQVERLVKALEDFNCEIILVDDHSELPVVVDGVKIIRNPRRLGVGESRNIGCRQAKGDWVLFLDDDLAPSPGLARFIDQLLPRLKTKDVVGFRFVGSNLIGGRPVEYRDTTFSRMLNILFGVDISPNTGPSRFIPAPAMMFQSDFFSSLGGFDSRTFGGNGFRESSDLQWRARKLGGRLIYVEDPSFQHLNIPGGQEKGRSENDVYFMRNQTIFALRSGGIAALAMIAGFGAYMIFKGFRISGLVRGIALGLSVVLQSQIVLSLKEPLNSTTTRSPVLKTCFSKRDSR